MTKFSLLVLSDDFSEEGFVGVFSLLSSLFSTLIVSILLSGDLSFPEFGCEELPGFTFAELSLLSFELVLEQLDTLQENARTSASTEYAVN